MPRKPQRNGAMPASSHANRGRVWESALEMLHQRWMTGHRALVIRTPPPMKILRNQGGATFVACFEKEGPPDYLVISQGWTLLVEAKSFGARLGWSCLPAHQAETMDRAMAQSDRAHGLLLIYANDTASAYAVLWQDVRERYWAWANRTGRAVPGSASLTHKQLRELAVTWGRGAIDYLHPVTAELAARTTTDEEQRADDRRCGDETPMDPRASSA